VTGAPDGCVTPLWAKYYFHSSETFLFLTAGHFYATRCQNMMTSPIRDCGSQRETAQNTFFSIVAPTRSIKITCFINYNRMLHKTTNPYLPVIYSVLLSPHQDPLGKNQNAISRYSLTVLANSNRALYKSMLVLHSVSCIHR